MSCKYVNLSRFSLLLVVVSMAGCAIFPAAQEQPGARVAGILTLESGQLRLSPCDSSTPLAVAASGNIHPLFERVAQPGKPAVFVDMTARAAAAGGLEPVEVIRLQAGGNGCADQASARSRWVAMGGVAPRGVGAGDEPAWRVQISPAGMQWQGAAASSSVPVPVISEEVPGSAISFATLRGTPQELWITPQGCYAQSSGDYFHRTARLMRNGETLTGCAYRGLLP